jgi:hypothetical protein
MRVGGKSFLFVDFGARESRRGDLLFTGRVLYGYEVNPLAYLHVMTNGRNRAITLPTLDAVADQSTAPVDGCVLQQFGVGSSAGEDADAWTVSYRSIYRTLFVHE